jgi:hypothetical protein
VAYPLRLKVFKGDQMIASRDFERDHIKIGRLASAHLTIDDEKVSRIHSVIEASSDGKLSIIDMGSVEGTYVNGKRVNKGALSFGDEIRVGATTIKLENVTEQAAANLQAAVQAGDETSEATKTDLVASTVLAQAAEAVAPVVAVSPAPAHEPVAAKAEAPARIPTPAPQPAPAIDPSFAITEQHTVLPAEPRARAIGKKKGALGLSVRLRWGDQIVAETLLRPGAKGTKGAKFTVGSAPGVSFAMGDSKLGAPLFVAAQSDQGGHQVRFTGKMVGELQHKGEIHDLKSLIEGRKADHDGDGYALSIGPNDFFWADLGGVVLEACLQQVPKPVFVPFGEDIDYTALNIFLLIFFLGAMFIVASMNKNAAGDEYADELNTDEARIAKLIIKPPDMQKNPLLQQLAQEKAKAGEAPAKHSGDEGQMGKKDAPKRNNRAAPKGDVNNKDQARMMAQKIFGKGGAGLATLFGDHNGMGGELKAAMGNMVGSATGDSGGLEGLGMKGGGGGGGGTGNTIGIGAVGTKGRAGGVSGYGNGTGIMGGKKSADIGITSADPVVMGSLDPELIRKVVHEHAGQIRYCYETELIKNPKLNGKVAIRWVITASGTVASSNVAQTTVNDSTMEECLAGRVRTWIFPKPKGGGVVVVTYPFLFKPSGE